MKLNIHSQEHILLWSTAAIKIMDVRHTILKFDEKVRSYQFPSSVFMFAIRGSAQVLLDDFQHDIKQFHVLHGGKGTFLNVFPSDAEFEYYMIFYKATIPLPCRQEISSLMERYNPFRLQYGFSPFHSAALFDKAEKMLKVLRNSSALQDFHVKTLFYQFVYELLQQLEYQQINMVKPNLTDQITRYIHEHYNDPITLESIAHIFHYSVPYLSKQFRQETANSIIDYVIKVRVDKAKELLQKTDMTIQEIAISVGYADVSYFNRIFKKYAGMAPGKFKECVNEKKKLGFDRPIHWIGSSIVPKKLRRYIDIGYDNHYQYKREGNSQMYRSRPSMGVTLLLCLTLLLSACSAAAPSTNLASASPINTSSTTAVPATEGNTQPSAQAGNSSSVAEMMTYTAVNGEIKVPKNPQRVVVIPGGFVGHLLALGIMPIGVAEEAFTPYTKDKLNGVINIGEGIPLEKILELNPDLIIVWNDPKALEDLSKIAPTVAVEYGKPLREQLLEIGKMTNREEQAQAWITAWDQKIAKYKPIVAATVGAKTISIFDSSSAKEFYAYGKNLGRGGDIIYGEFGLKAPPIIQKEALDSGQGWAKLSLELLPEYAGDYIIISGWTGKTDSEIIFKGAIWDKLSAVQNKQVFYENGRGFIFNDPVSLEAQLDFVVDSLT